MGLKPTEVILILLVLLLLFGAGRLPQLGSSFGQAIRNFKKGFGGEDENASLPPGSNSVTPPGIPTSPEAVKTSKPT